MMGILYPDAFQNATVFLFKVIKHESPRREIENLPAG
jgi:hypothetical protein